MLEIEKDILNKSNIVTNIVINESMENIVNTIEPNNLLVPS